jgi:hypothetical protein
VAPPFTAKTASTRTAELKLKSVLCEDLYTSNLAISHTLSSDITRYNGVEGSSSIKNLKSCVETNQVLFESGRDSLILAKSSSLPCTLVGVHKPTVPVWIKNDLYSRRNDNVCATCTAIGRVRNYDIQTVNEKIEENS